jgi:hypothetical protein
VYHESKVKLELLVRSDLRDLQVLWDHRDHKDLPDLNEQLVLKGYNEWLVQVE